MEFNLGKIIELIKSHPDFQKLKNVIENIDGFHDQEDVFTHSIKTANTALELIAGNFILNSDAKEKFLGFMEEDVYGMKRKEIAVIVGLLHDCGKLLSYKEHNTSYSLNMKKPTDLTQTTAPGHEYFGGKIVAKKILEDLEFQKDLAEFICRMIQLHSVINDNNYFAVRSSWNIQDLTNDVKFRVEERYIEGLFNALCDCYTAEGFKIGKEKIIQLFNNPDLYKTREYFIP